MRGGLILPWKKEAALFEWKIKRPRGVGRVRVPLGEPGCGTLRACVDVGQHVRTGQKIGEPQTALGVAAHAGVSGKVSDIALFPHPISGKMPAVEIIPDREEKTVPGLGAERKDWGGLPEGFLVELFCESGLVEMGGYGRALHRLVSAHRQKGAEILIVNACESEPYLTSDYALAMSHPLDILKGAEILRRLIGAERAVIATGDDKLEAAELLKSKIYFLKWDHFEVAILPARYPQDHDEILAHEIMRKKGAERNGAAVYNIATAFAVYEAVVMNKPLYERAVTVGGECLIEPKNLWLRIGSSFSDAIAACRGFLREPERLLMDGPMRGTAQTDKQMPVLKGTHGILALPKMTKNSPARMPCIRCGRCIENCPAGLSPMMITVAYEGGFKTLAKSYAPHFCIGCGNCTYVCPAKIPLAERVAAAAKIH
jgi:electron transport complex protein RnfC